MEEEGELATLRNSGAKRARGDILVFTDDDIRADKNWLRSIVESFNRRHVVGVSGPSIILDRFRCQRDLFRYGWIKSLYDFFFLEGKGHLCGRFTRAGTWTTGACENSCDYNGEVDYLEASNMSFKKKSFWEIGGFDEIYRGVGDWSEPDAAFKLRKKGYKLWFNSRARLFHEPSRTGAYNKRAGESKIRLNNYLTFAKRWVKPCWRHSLFKLFLRIYYEIKTIK